MSGMDIQYEATTAPEDADWRVRGTVNVYGDAGAWVVFASVVPAHGFSIVELRVLPAEFTGTRSDPDAPFGFREFRAPTEANARGTWSGRPDVAPRGGIPTRLLREIREQDIQTAARTWFIGHGLHGGTQDQQWRIAAERIARGRKAARNLTPDQRLAVIAARYVALLDAGSRSPNAALAEELGRRPEWVTQEIYRARQRGVLAPRKVGRGQAAGHLTDRARELLNEVSAKDGGCPEVRGT